MRGDNAGFIAGQLFRGRGPFCPRSYNCSSDHCAGLLPRVQITVGSAVASSGCARTSAAIHPDGGKTRVSHSCFHPLPWPLRACLRFVEIPSDLAW
jgi:hypothetical protein